MAGAPRAWYPIGSLDSLLELGLALVALVLRGVLTGADAAMIGVGRSRADELLRAGDIRAAWLVRLKAGPEGASAGARAGTSLLLALAAALATLAGHRWHEHVAWYVAAAAGVAGAALAIDLVFRSLCAAHPEPWALRLARPLWFAAWTVGPVARLYRWVADLALEPLGVAARFSNPRMPLEDIERTLVAHARADLTAPAAELIHSVFTFGGKTVKEVMIPRTEVVAIPLDALPDEVVRVLTEEGHTRMPVYTADLDHVVGVLHGKDVLGLLANPSLIVLQDLVRPTIFTPWSKAIGALMKEMQQQRHHIAMVVDEHGGFMGVVTLEDIIEEIVGEIGDEVEGEDKLVEPQPDGAALVRAELRVADFNEHFGAGVPESDAYETLGGFVSSLAGAIPAQGDRFYVGGLELTVARRSDRRVLLLRVAKTGRA